MLSFGEECLTDAVCLISGVITTPVSFSLRQGCSDAQRPRASWEKVESLNPKSEPGTLTYAPRCNSAYAILCPKKPRSRSSPIGHAQCLLRPTSNPSTRFQLQPTAPARYVLSTRLWPCFRLTSGRFLPWGSLPARPASPRRFFRR